MAFDPDTYIGENDTITNLLPDKNCNRYSTCSNTKVCTIRNQEQEVALKLLGNVETCHLSYRFLAGHKLQTINTSYILKNIQKHGQITRFQYKDLTTLLKNLNL
jgi:hypothetical protein